MVQKLSMLGNQQKKDMRAHQRGFLENKKKRVAKDEEKKKEKMKEIQKKRHRKVGKDSHNKDM